jgi:hypothetical protein
MSDHALQFSFTPAPPKPNFVEPEWMKVLGRWIGGAVKFLTPYAIDLFWMGVGAAIVAVLYLILREIMGSRWPFRRKRTVRVKPADWRPDPFRAKALLADADRLAAEGRYDEAAHVLLFRSIDDIEDRRPRLVRPALTARDIGALDALPPAAREAFGVVAAAVERSLFGGRTLDASTFAEARAAYQAFAFGESWS